jgi:two-component system, chemotaxis family, sensor kinase Cph1
LAAPSDNETRAALEHCAHEPVHTPGAIQPAGCLICLDDAYTRVTRVSANIDAFLGVDAVQALSRTPGELLGARLMGRIRRDLTDRDRMPSPLGTTRQIDGDVRRYRVFAYRSGTQVVVEFERQGRGHHDRLLSLVNDWLSRFAQAHSVDVLLDMLVEGVRGMTGYDRVMVYQFDPDWHGAVVAESRTAAAGSFLGHHFPASDIPPQVRRLYDVNPVRMVADATAAAVPLVPADGDGHGHGEPDLSPGVLRAVSPVHLAYLHNMGVQAAFSIAMHGSRDLWGLVAAQGLRPRPLAPSVRDAARTLVQMATQRLFLLKARDRADFLEGVRVSRGPLSDTRGRLRRPGEIIREHGGDWLSLFGASGCALVHRENTSGIGRVPDEARLDRIVGWLNAEHQGSGVWHHRRLGHTGLAGLIPREEACGLLAVPLPLGEIAAGWLLLFRPETIESVRWAGNPAKAVVDDNGRAGLSPRQSFETWLQEVVGRSAPWTELERHAATDLAEDLAVAVSGREIAIINDRLRREHEALAEANARLRDLAHTDSLTRVWNRYRIEAAIDVELNAADRYSRPCALVLFDVDHFKRVNDTHGHEAGDRVLVGIAGLVGRILRNTDHLGRWGGEEFVVLATNSRLEDAVRLAERLRSGIEAIDFGDVGRITASFGVAACTPDDTRRALVDRADRAMYRAKEGGRNRVVSAAAPESAT